MELAFLFSTIKRFFLLVLICAIGSTVALVGLRQRQATVYEAKAVVLLRQPAGEAEQNPDRYMETQVSYLQSSRFIEQVVSKIDGATRLSVRSNTKIEPRPGTDVLDISAFANTPAESEKLAATYANEYLRDLKSRTSDRTAEQVSLLTGQIVELDDLIAKAQRKRSFYPAVPVSAADLTSVGETEREIAALFNRRSALDTTRETNALKANLTQVSEIVQVPEGEASPKRLPIFGALGLIFGLGLGSLLALFLGSTRRRVLQSAEVSTVLGTPLMAQFGKVHVLKKRPWERFSPLPTKVAEEVDRLCVRIESMSSVSSQTLVVTVTSAQSGAGVTTLASMIAMRFAERGLMTVLMDGDLSDPELSRTWTDDPQIGLANLLTGSGVDMRHFAPTPIRGLRVLGLGDIWGMRRVLSKTDTHEVLDRICQHAEVLVIDGGSIRDVASTVRFAVEADAVVLAIPSHSQQPDVFRSAADILGPARARSLPVETTPTGVGSIRQSFGLNAKKRPSQAKREMKQRKRQSGGTRRPVIDDPQIIEHQKVQNTVTGHENGGQPVVEQMPVTQKETTPARRKR